MQGIGSDTVAAGVFVGLESLIELYVAAESMPRKQCLVTP